MAVTLEDLVAEQKANQTAFLEALKTQSKEIRESNRTSSETSKSLKSLEKRFLDSQNDVLTEMKKLEGESKSQKDRADELEAKMSRAGSQGGERPKSLGEQFTESDVYKAFQKSAQTTMGQVRLGQIWSDKKDLTVNESRGVLSTQLDQALYALPRLRQRHIRDYMNVVKTTKAQLQYVVETGYTNAAAIRAEGQPASLSSITFDTRSASATQVSHGLVMTKEQAKDMPTMLNFVENRMVNGIYHAEDRQLVAGTNESIEGFTQVTGRQTYDRFQSGDTKIDTLRRAQTMLQLLEYQAFPTVYGVAPVDWEEMELQKDGEERYLWVQVMVGGEPRLWRVPVFPTTAVDPGTFFTGDLQQSSTLYDLEEADVEIFNQHGEFALAGKLLLFGEERIYVAHQIPELIITGSYTGAGSGSGS